MPTWAAWAATTRARRRSRSCGLWHGEGVLYGLGCCVKLPTDLTRAPYMLITTGVTTLPQRVTFPLSLISEPLNAIGDLSPAANEIAPG